MLTSWVASDHHFSWFITILIHKIYRIHVLKVWVNFRTNHRVIVFIILAASQVFTKNADSDVESALSCSIIFGVNGNLLNLMLSRECCVSLSLSVAMNVSVLYFFAINHVVGGSDYISSSRFPRFLNTTNKPRSHISIIVPVHPFNLDNMFISGFPIIIT